MVFCLGANFVACVPDSPDQRISSFERNYATGEDASEPGTADDASEPRDDANTNSGFEDAQSERVDMGTTVIIDSGSSIDAGIIDAGQTWPDANYPDAAPPPDSGQAVCGNGMCEVPQEDCQSCSADCGPCNWPVAQTTEEDAMVGLVNQLRATGTSCGSTTHAAVGPVTMNQYLREAARLHSQDMADQDYFSHTSLDGRSPWDRIGATAYQGSGVGENIAAGNSTAQRTFTQWLNSPGHCRNMMNGSANEMGVGYAVGQGNYTHYWTQVFGRR